MEAMTFALVTSADLASKRDGNEKGKPKTFKALGLEAAVLGFEGLMTGGLWEGSGRKAEVSAAVCRW